MICAGAVFEDAPCRVFPAGAAERFDATTEEREIWSSGTVRAKVGRLCARTCVNASNPDLDILSVLPSGTALVKSAPLVGIPALVQLLEIEGVGHDLGRNHSGIAAKIALSFLEFAA